MEGLNAPLDLSVVIVSFNTRDLLLRCVEALHKTEDIEMDIWVVDNRSLDGSPDAVAQSYPSVYVIRNVFNRGFAAACNQGIKASRGRYVLLVNSDAFIDKSLPRTIVEFMDDYPLAAAVGCKLLNADGSLQPSCFRTPTLVQALLEFSRYNARHPRNRFNRSFRMLDWNYESVREVPCVAGACMAMRRDAVNQLGGLDEHYFMYFEDFDWCERARKEGWRVLYCPTARATHLGSCSMSVAGPDVGEASLQSLRRYMFSVNRRNPGKRLLIAALTGLWLLLHKAKRLVSGYNSGRNYDK